VTCAINTTLTYKISRTALLLRDADMHSAYLLRRRGLLAGWLAGCPSHAGTAKPILKLFRPSGSAIIIVSSDPCGDTQFQGEPIQRGR